MILFVWNCRGIGRPATIRTLREYIRVHRPEIIFLSETKLVCSDRVVRVALSVGYPNVHSVPARGKAGGLVMCWKQSVNLNIVVANDFLINCIVTGPPGGTDISWQLTCVYGPTIPSRKPDFWDALHRIGDSYNGPWIVAGDFNAVLNSSEKQGGRTVASSSNDAFRDMVDQNGLIDLGFSGYRFTWNNNRGGRANIQERLDRALVNGLWRLKFPAATVFHLTAFNSDHRPITIDTAPAPQSRPRPFRFEAMWTREKSADIVIEQAWNKLTELSRFQQIMTKIKHTKVALKEWNVKVFGHLQSRISQVKKEIEALQAAFPIADSFELEQRAQHDLDELLLKERILWMEKAKARWLEEGDANTHFFHLSTIVHRRHNHILSIYDSRQRRITDCVSIGNAFVEFYTNLYSTSSPVFDPSFQDLIAPSVTAEQNDALCSMPSISEVYKALFSMANNKSPGPDGMTPVFFKTYWSIVGKDVYQAVRHFFESPSLSRAANHTFITLIPKRPAANRVDQFRPIALCNIIYKVITKLLSSRLKGLLDSLIHPNQAAFVPNRSIVENGIINHEVMHYMRRRKGRKYYMAIKVDMAKAYDMVEWEVLIAILRRHGFCAQFCTMIRECISSAWFSILINGSPHGYFPSTRGIRQGDPISPALFTFLSDLLSRILAKAELDQQLSGIKVSRTSPRISHLMYADDLVIYGQATDREALQVKHCLTKYCTWTGQSINWDKSMIHFSNNTPRSVRHSVCHLLNMQECSHTGKYLGHPFCSFKSKSLEFGPIIERLKGRLAGWKEKALSQAGRTILVKAVAAALPSYVMQTFLLPKGICRKLDSIVSRFWWGFKDDNRHLFLKSWESLCTPLCSGGLGFRQFFDVNKAFITKLVWKLCTEPHRIWVQLIRSKYLRGRRVLDFQHAQQSASWVWYGIQSCVDSLRRGICCKVRRNSLIHTYEDPWLPDCSMYSVPSTVQPNAQLFYVRNLLIPDGSAWDHALVRANFPFPICRSILSTPISTGEHDEYVWIPSKSGIFTIRSSYLTNIAYRLPSDQAAAKRKWKFIWHSDLHARHKLLFWKTMHNLLPTRDRIKQFIAVESLNCLLCGQDVETIEHLLFHCPLSIQCWGQSPWGIRIQNLSQPTVETWLLSILDVNSSFLQGLSEDDRPRVAHFAAITLETFWRLRNDIRRGGALPELAQLFQSVVTLADRYWTAAKQKAATRRRLPRLTSWIPPLLGEVKFNVDASFVLHDSYTGIVLRNHAGIVLGAWSHHFYSPNALCAEMAVMTQALTIADDMRLPKVCFEGDSLEVVLAMNDVQIQADWRAKEALERGRNLLKSHCLWSVSFVHREGNCSAHKVAQWARNVSFCGPIDLGKLPEILFCDSGDPPVNILDVDEIDG